MSHYVITVNFRMAPGREDQFMELILENARLSLANEQGCLVFDVLRPVSGPPDQVLLYEVYRDRAAFEAHLRTPHFLSFDAAVGDLITAKTVVEFTVESGAYTAKAAIAAT